MKDNAPKKLLEILNLSSDYLSEHGIENARLNAERLLGHALNMNRMELYLNYDRPLTAEEINHFRRYLKRRLRQEPLQYILGETEFMSLPLKVNPSVLIPRPETEILVEKTMEASKQQRLGSDETLRILDIGTGSGCIAISLARHLDRVEITAIDVSEAALKTAAENARLNQVEDRIRFRKLDFLHADLSEEISNKFHILVSNPPYISQEDFVDLPEEVKGYEPKVALQDGANGVDFYRQIAKTAPMLLRKDGFVAVEVGMGQAKAVEEIFTRQGFVNTRTFEDLTGIERVVMCER